MLRFCSFLLLFAGLLQATPCDLIVSGRYVVTMSPRRQIVENGAIAISGDHIVAVGPKSAIDRDWQPRRRLDRPGSLLAPGLINTHTHAAMSLFRGVADDLKLQDWLTRFIFPAEAKNVSQDFVRWGTRLACLEMLLSGTTTFTDMYYFEDVVAETVKEAGMRGVLGETVIGFPAPDAKTPADALRFSERFLTRFRDDPLVVPTIAPHALYTNSDETLKAARALANRFSAPILIHLSETKKENDDNLAKRRQTPTQTLESLGLFSGRTIAAHCVWVDANDIGILRRKNVGVAHCPSSNMKLASGAAPVVNLLGQGIAVGVGTDGPAGSNNDFDLLEEVDLAAKLQKLIRSDPQALPAAEAFALATSGGAKALGLDRQIGSLEVGKRADLIVLDLNTPNATPLFDVYSQLAYALKGSNVTDAIINGRQVVSNRRCLTLNPEVILPKAREYGLQVAASVHYSK